MTDFRPEDEPPDGRTAQAQRLQTVMPWVWGAVGILVIAAFVALLLAPSLPNPFHRGPTFEPADHGTRGAGARDLTSPR